MAEAGVTLSSLRAGSTPVTREGFLGMKERGRMRGKWKRRFCLLVGEEIHFFRFCLEDETNVSMGSISLKNTRCEIVEQRAASKKKKKRYEFTVVSVEDVASIIDGTAAPAEAEKEEVKKAMPARPTKKLSSSMRTFSGLRKGKSGSRLDQSVIKSKDIPVGEIVAKFCAAFEDELMDWVNDSVHASVLHLITDSTKSEEMVRGARASLVTKALSDDDMADDDGLDEELRKMEIKAQRKKEEEERIRREALEKRRKLVMLQSIWRTVQTRRWFKKTAKESAYRKRVHEELLATEETYVKSLIALEELYIQPLREKKKLSDEVFALIFSNIHSILGLHTMLLDDMRARLGLNWFPNQKVADLFVYLAAQFKLYTAYVNNFDAAIKQVMASQAKNSGFAKIAAQAEQDPRSQSLQLGGFLIMPVQRLPRYEMLLKDILKHTWEEHPDYEDLQQAVGIIAGIAAFVNERKREEENFSKMAEVQRRMVGKGTPDLVQPHRKWIKEGELVELDKGGKQVERYLFLFTDMLLCANQKGQVNFKKLAQTIRYNNQWCLDVEDLKVDLHADGVTFRMMSLGELRMLRAATAEERSEWLAAIAQVKRLIVEKKQALHDIPQ